MWVCFLLTIIIVCHDFTKCFLNKIESVSKEKFNKSSLCGLLSCIFIMIDWLILSRQDIHLVVMYILNEYI